MKLSVTSSMHVVLPAVEKFIIMVQIVAQNPIAYYNLVDYASRTCGRAMADVRMLRAVGICTHFPWGCSRVYSKQLFTSKQHVKAYISSVASWVKAFILTLGPREHQAAASGAGGGQELGSEGWVRMVRSLDLAIVDLRTVYSNSTSSASAELQQEDIEDAFSAYLRTAELNLLLWVSRAVSVVAQQLMHHLEDEQQKDLAGSSSSRHRVAAAFEGTSSSGGDGISSASGSHPLASSAGGGSSSCGVTSNQVNSSVQCHGSSSPGGDDGTGGSSSISSGPGGSSHVTSTAAHGSSRSSTGGLCLQEGSRVLMMPPSSACVTGTTLALELHRQLRQWLAGQSSGVRTASSAAEVPLAAGAAIAAAHNGDDGPSCLPRQLCEDLPIAVVKQLEKCSSRWPVEVGSSTSSNSSERPPLSEAHRVGESSCGLLGTTSNSSASSNTNHSTSSRDPLEDKEVQRLVLGDVIKLCQVLQQEVPTIVGCNNPLCLNVTGMLESAASRKVCTGCNVAHYCSRECQVGHWKEHMVTCKRLQKGQGTGKHQQ